MIHRARWTDPAMAADPIDVAVKRFKGAMTSDGLPTSEMAACLAAGEHPGLIPVRGRLEAKRTATPPGEARDPAPDGLVLDLIDPSFRPLAGPPSLHSCTRDVYADDVRPDLDTALRLLRRIAAVTAHLHARGVVHGDLYGHNILWRPDTGEALLGDFGAASFHGCAGPALGPALQAMEVRALGVLIGEMLERVPAPADAPDPRLDTVARWAARCLDKNPDRRPTATALARALAEIPSASPARLATPGPEQA